MPGDPDRRPGVPAREHRAGPRRGCACRSGTTGRRSRTRPRPRGRARAVIRCRIGVGPMARRACMSHDDFQGSRAPGAARASARRSGRLQPLQGLQAAQRAAAGERSRKCDSAGISTSAPIMFHRNMKVEQDAHVGLELDRRPGPGDDAGGQRHADQRDHLAGELQRALVGLAQRHAARAAARAAPTAGRARSRRRCRRRARSPAASRP